MAAVAVNPNMMAHLLNNEENMGAALMTKGMKDNFYETVKNFAAVNDLMQAQSREQYRVEEVDWCMELLKSIKKRQPLGDFAPVVQVDKATESITEEPSDKHENTITDTAPEESIQNDIPPSIWSVDGHHTDTSIRIGEVLKNEPLELRHTEHPGGRLRAPIGPTRPEASNQNDIPSSIWSVEGDHTDTSIRIGEVLKNDPLELRHTEHPGGRLRAPIRPTKPEASKPVTYSVRTASMAGVKEKENAEKSSYEARERKKHEAAEREKQAAEEENRKREEKLEQERKRIQLVEEKIKEDEKKDQERKAELERRRVERAEKAEREREQARAEAEKEAERKRAEEEEAAERERERERIKLEQEAERIRAKQQEEEDRQAQYAQLLEEEEEREAAEMARREALRQAAVERVRAANEKCRASLKAAARREEERREAEQKESERKEAIRSEAARKEPEKAEADRKDASRKGATATTAAASSSATVNENKRETKTVLGKTVETLTGFIRKNPATQPLPQPSRFHTAPSRDRHPPPREPIPQRQVQPSSQARLYGIEEPARPMATNTAARSRANDTNQPAGRQAAPTAAARTQARLNAANAAARSRLNELNVPRTRPIAANTAARSRVNEINVPRTRPHATTAAVRPRLNDTDSTTSRPIATTTVARTRDEADEQTGAKRKRTPERASVMAPPKRPSNMVSRPMQMLRPTMTVSNARIPFAENPNPPAQASAAGPSEPRHRSPVAVDPTTVILPEIHTDSEEESSDDDYDPEMYPNKKPKNKWQTPDWAKSPALKSQLEDQQVTEQPWGEIQPMGELEELFDFGKNQQRANRLRVRGSSALWEQNGDALTEVEKADDKALRERIVKEGGWRSNEMDTTE